MEELLKVGMVAVFAGVGAYFGTYLKRKGENRAIREDLDTLVDQVRAVTTTTKEIEAKISNDMWGRQKRWELKREVLFEAVRSLARVQNALLSFHSVFLTRRDQQSNDPVWLGAVTELITEASTEWLRVSREFEEATLLIGIVCGGEARDAGESLRGLMNRIASELSKGDPEAYSKSIPEMTRNSLVFRVAIRKELEAET